MFSTRRSRKADVYHITSAGGTASDAVHVITAKDSAKSGARRAASRDKWRPECEPHPTPEQDDREHDGLEDGGVVVERKTADADVRVSRTVRRSVAAGPEEEVADGPPAALASISGGGGGGADADDGGAKDALTTMAVTVDPVAAAVLRRRTPISRAGSRRWAAADFVSVVDVVRLCTARGLHVTRIEQVLRQSHAQAFTSVPGWDRDSTMAFHGTPPCRAPSVAVHGLRLPGGRHASALHTSHYVYESGPARCAWHSSGKRFEASRGDDVAAAPGIYMTADPRTAAVFARCGGCGCGRCGCKCVARFRCRCDGTGAHRADRAAGDEADAFAMQISADPWARIYPGRVVASAQREAKGRGGDAGHIGCHRAPPRRRAAAGAGTAGEAEEQAVASVASGRCECDTTDDGGVGESAGGTRKGGAAHRRRKARTAPLFVGAVNLGRRFDASGPRKECQRRRNDHDGMVYGTRSLEELVDPAELGARGGTGVGAGAGAGSAAAGCARVHLGTGTDFKVYTRRRALLCYAVWADPEPVRGHTYIRVSSGGGLVERVSFGEEDDRDALECAARMREDASVADSKSWAAASGFTFGGCAAVDMAPHDSDDDTDGVGRVRDVPYGGPRRLRGEFTADEEEGGAAADEDAGAGGGSDPSFAVGPCAA